MADEKTPEEEKDHMAAFLDALETKLMVANAEAMREIFNGVLPPFNARLEQIAQAQITLALALKTNRRDEAARIFAKLFVEKAMADNDGVFNIGDVHSIAANAYALADEMEVHGRVAEIQAGAKGERVEKHLEENPKADSKALVESYFGRGGIPKAPSSKPSKSSKKH